MDYIVHGVTKSWTRLSNFHFHVHIPVLISMAIYAQDQRVGKYLSLEDLDSAMPNLKIWDPKYYITYYTMNSS